MRNLNAHRPFDTRFRACARLLQSIWRDRQGLPLGSFTGRDGATRKIGSLISPKVADQGRNFLTPDIARLARREAAYREPGALIDERRLWTNLLSSSPMTLNLFGPLRLDLDLATQVLRRICPDLADATVRAVKFEHSPGRGDQSLTGDYTTFDVLIAYDRPSIGRGFVAIEAKYSEAMNDPKRKLKARYAEAGQLAALHRDPDTPSLAKGSLQQFYRQHVLAQMMLMRDDFAEGRFIVVAPQFNTSVQKAITRYAGYLAEPTDDQVTFAGLTVEDVVEAFRDSSEERYAAAFEARYLDWSAIDQVIEAGIAEQGGMAG